MKGEENEWGYYLRGVIKKLGGKNGKRKVKRDDLGLLKVLLSVLRAQLRLKIDC